MALWRKHDTAPTNVNYPPEIDGQIADGRAVVGTPDNGAARRCAPQLAESGANYMVCRFAFGDMTLAESLRSLELFSARDAGAARERAGRGGVAVPRAPCHARADPGTIHWLPG